MGISAVSGYLRDERQATVTAVLLMTCDLLRAYAPGTTQDRILEGIIFIGALVSLVAEFVMRFLKRRNNGGKHVA